MAYGPFAASFLLGIVAGCWLCGYTPIRAVRHVYALWIYRMGLCRCGLCRETTPTP